MTGVQTCALPICIGQDPVAMNIQSAIDGYVYVVMLGSDEKSFYLLFPNKIDTNNRRNYTIKYNLPIKHGEFKNKLLSYPEVEVYDASNISRNVFFEEVPDVSSGINSLLTTSVSSVGGLSFALLLANHYAINLTYSGSTLTYAADLSAATLDVSDKNDRRLHLLGIY